MLITLSIITLILYVILIFLFLNSDESNKIKARNIISATIGLLGINVAFFCGDNYISNDESSSIIEATYINTETIETERNNIEYTVESNSSDILPSSEDLNTDNYDESNVVIQTEYPDVFPTTQISRFC